MSERERAEDGLSRTLAAFVREEFQAPVEGLRGLLDMLSEDVAEAGLLDYEPDIGRMRSAADRLLAQVAALLDGDGDTAPSTIRHDLRTPITAILGYGELVAEEARDRDDAVLFAPLADVLVATGRLLKDVDRLVAFAGDVGSAGGPTDRVPDVLRNAVAVAQALSRHEAVPQRTVTGRILVVDDNAAIRDLAARRLTREGHDVTVCASGLAALDRATRQSFDLMLLDLMMPGLNGLEVLIRLRQNAATAGLPVIVISALDEVEAAVRCIEAGADDFLSKPLNDTLLRARISSSLERKFLRDREADALLRLQAAQERSDQLLRNVLPASVVERLRGGETAIADHFDDVTVLFCDLVGFTALSATLNPAGTIDLLNGIFSGFDRLAEENGLEKIKTVGDAYMVVGGMSEPMADHTLRVVRMARGMPAVAAAASDEHALGVRIGIDRGPASAGIIGRRKFFYDVWGDTVNTASRLEATADPGTIHVSETVRDAVAATYTCRALAPLVIKGKGVMRTYRVEG